MSAIFFHIYKIFATYLSLLGRIRQKSNNWSTLVKFDKIKDKWVEVDVNR